ncbi:MAG: tryptophan synthase subunit alpha [bacterium]|mgnify:CR=1 FL=1
MSRIDEVFKKLKAEGRVALMPFITAGDPSLDVTGKIIREMERAGADIIELGIPFSDPLADGPTIQRSSQRALAGGVSLSKILLFLKEQRSHISMPVVLMGYYNPIFRYGLERFARDAKDAGADGLIVPDLPPEEAEDLIREARRVDLDTVFLLAPTSTRERIERVASVSRGFLYYVSLTGVTGARSRLSDDIGPSIAKIREVTSQPVCVGFGISKPEHVRAVSGFADGVIVGSALVGFMEERLNDPGCPAQAGDFLLEFRKAAKRQG